MLVSAVDTCDGNRELGVAELIVQDLHGVVKMVSEQEEGGCVLEPATAHQCVGILECGGLPALFLKIIGEQAMRCALFA